MAKNRKKPYIRPRSVQMAVLASTAALCLAVLVQLGTEVFARFKQLESTPLENTQWTGQLEVEYLEFSLAVARAREVDGTNAALAHVRKRYNLLYSRVDVLIEGSLYRNALGPETQENFLTISKFIKGLSYDIDGTNAVLNASLGRIETDLANMRPLVRRATVDTGQTFSKRSQTLRSEVSGVLIHLAITIALLLIALLWLLTLFWQLYKANRRRARQTLETSARLSTIISISQDAIIVSDEKGRIQEYNGAAEKLFGIPKSKALRGNVSELLRSPDDDGKTYSPLARGALIKACNTGPRTCHRLQGHHTEGHDFPVEISMDITRRRGQVHCVSFIRDISHRVQAEAALKATRDAALASEKAKSRFLAVMSHEMRTPLNGIMGSIDLIRESKTDNEREELLDVIQGSGQVLLGHVNDVLDITEFESDSFRLSNAPFDLDTLISQIVRAARPAAENRGTRLASTNNDKPLGWVIGDQARIRQILTNLVANAVKFTTNGLITVEASRTRKDMIEFQVTDTGVGIPLGKQANIFDDFVRAGNTTAGRPEGSGLGLGIAKNLVQAMGGEIGFESFVGEGSVFWFRVPLLATDRIQPDKNALNGKLDIPALPIDVLVVEDNSTNRFVVAEMLKRDGHKVQTAADGREGVEQARRYPFDLILMDISMPNLDGIEATRIIRTSNSQSSKTRIIALTAHVHDNDHQKFIEAGFDEVLHKPLRWTTLRQLVRDGRLENPDPKASRTTTVDTSVLNELMQALPEEKAQDLIDSFLKEGNQFLADLPELKDRPLPDVTARIHAFAGSAATFGARDLCEQLARAETAAGRAETDVLWRELEGLEALWQRTQPPYQVHVGE